MNAPRKLKSGAPRRHLKNFIIKPSLQIKFGFWAVALAVIFASVASGALYFHFAKLYDIILDLTDLREEVTTILHTYIVKAIKGGIVLVVVYVIANIVISVLMTHKMVGPTVAFRRLINSLIKGDYTARVHLRKNDAFAEVASDLNRLATNLEMLRKGASGSSTESFTRASSPAPVTPPPPPKSGPSEQ